MSDSPRSACLVGSGAIAHALARDLSGAGWGLSAWARRPERAPVPAVELAGVAGEPLVLVCVSDRAIASVAERLAAEGEARAAGPVVLHTSGFHGAEVLAPLVGRGWSTGSLHPLRSVPAGGAAASLRGGWFVVEGDERARGAAGAVVRALDGRELVLSAEAGAKARYHAAATLAAGGAVALLDAALELLGSTDSGRARMALAELAGGALENAGELGAAAALTGPVARGDVEVVAGHLEALDRVERADSAGARGARDPGDAGASGLAELYRALARRSLTLAREAGTLSPELAARLAGLLARS